MLISLTDGNGDWPGVSCDMPVAGINGRIVIALTVRNVRVLVVSMPEIIRAIKASLFVG